uniref:Universal stress protein 31 n=1 Tax=Salvia miltiorrhiza TaxID=226208 RepID=A0A290YXV4_SALMI|nr:universal stress protein 31 [Salvia miltiorrhiza]
MCRESSGDPKDRICRAVEEMNINLLVVGSRGLGQIKRAFLGSVSDTVLNTRNVLFS